MAGIQASNESLVGKQATALYGFDCGADGELSFVDGEVLTIVNQDVGEGWWEAANSRGERGLVPESYFEITEVPEPNFPPPPAPPASNNNNRTSWSQPVMAPSYNSQQSYTQSDTRPSSFAPQSSWNQQQQPPVNNNYSARQSMPAMAVQNSYPPPQPAAQQPPARPAQLPTQDSYDDWDDDWSDDDSSTTTERPEYDGTSGPTSRKEKKDKDNEKFGTVRKPFSKFSNFTKQGGEAYLFNTSPTHVPESDKKVSIVETEDGPTWQYNQSPFTCVIASPKKESKYHGIKSFIAYQLTPSYSNIQVSRRYKHFDWLHKQLEEKFTVVAIPPLPDKQIAGRFEDDFIQGRMQQLQLWIDRLCQHPAVAHSDVFNHFLACTDEKRWKEGKRRAEKDEYQGGKWFLTLQAPPHRLDATDTEVKLDKFGKYIKNMDDSVRHMMSVGESNFKKHQGPFKKEFSKLGGSFVALAKSFEFDERPVAQNLTRAVENTGRTYEDIGKLFQCQPREDLLPLLEGLQEYKGILSTFPDTLNVYRAASAKIQENAGRLSDGEIDDVQSRADVIAYATLAEMNHFQHNRVGDFKNHMQNYLRGQIGFYRQITEKLEVALQQFEQA